MSKSLRRQALVAAVLAGAAQLACAAWVSIKVTAPTDGGGPYTDVHFETSGDGDSEGFQSQVANDFTSALSLGYSSNGIAFAKVGMLYGDSQPEAICFFFEPDDLLQEGAMLEIVLDLPWVSESGDAAAESNFNTTNARLSRAGGVLFGIPGPTVTHFKFDNILLGQFEPIRMVPGAFDGRILELNRVPLPGTLWQVLLGLAALGSMPLRKRLSLK